jgi:hypothetical protein
VRSYEHGNKPFGFIRERGFLNQLNTYQLLKNSLSAELNVSLKENLRFSCHNTVSIS